MKRFIVAILSALSLLTAQANTAINTVGSDDRTAIAGFDVVSFFNAKKSVPGTLQYSFEYEGVKWLFSTEENLNAFKAKPDAFLPAWGGHCAWAISEKSISSKKVSGDFEIIDGKLYLFSYGRNQKSGAKDDFLYGRYSKSLRLRDGERAWPEIKAGLENGTLPQPDSKTYQKSQFEK